MTWDDFASNVSYYQRGFMGEPNEVRPGRGEFHENPSACICEDSEAKTRAMTNSKSGKFEDATGQEVSFTDRIDDYSDNDFDPEWVDPDDDGDQGNALENTGDDGTILDDDKATSDEPELEEIVSD